MITWDKLHLDHKHDLLWPDPIVVRFLAKHEKGMLLDVGCGSGRHTALALSHGYEVTACDISQAVITRIMVRYKEVRASCAPMTALPYTSDLFDYVISWAALEYAESEEALAQGIAEIHRVLKPGGDALMSLRADGDSRQQEPNPDDGAMTLQYVSNGQIRLLMRGWADVDFGRMTVTQHGAVNDCLVLTARK